MGKDTSFWLRFQQAYIIILKMMGGKRFFLFLFTFIFWWNVFHPTQVYCQDIHSENETAYISKSNLDYSQLWGEFYVESSASHHDDNIVNSAFVKEGMHLYKFMDNYLDVYLKARLYHDQDGYFWNNRMELGVGSRYKPISKLGLFLFLELLYGDYAGRETDDEPNPDDSSYWEMQGGFAFWQWWGIQPWQVDNLALYTPFNGWREVYCDGIYYDHDSNLIATLNYKEGLMLSRFANIGFDGYISLKTSSDTNEDKWNNYIKTGPGIRVTPFPNLDMKISFEYLLGKYYHGGFGDTSDNISDFEVIIAFWHGW